jgi:hypothetical protein
LNTVGADIGTSSSARVSLFDHALPKDRIDYEAPFPCSADVESIAIRGRPDKKSPTPRKGDLEPGYPRTFMADN